VQPGDGKHLPFAPTTSQKNNPTVDLVMNQPSAPPDMSLPQAVSLAKPFTPSGHTGVTSPDSSSNPIPQSTLIPSTAEYEDDGWERYDPKMFTASPTPASASHSVSDVTASSAAVTSPIVSPRTGLVSTTTFDQ
jgi:hypothetical protein